MHDLNYFRDHLDVFAEMAKKRGTGENEATGPRKFSQLIHEMVSSEDGSFDRR